MKITAVETIRLPERPNLLLAQVHTDAGLIGLGETSRGALAVEGQIHDDQIAFTQHADELAESLLSEGFSAMKIWPFDPLAERSAGSFLSREDLELGLAPWRKIRKAVGDRIEVMAEFHSLWNLQQAKQIAKALEPYRPYWSGVQLRRSALA